MADYEPLPRLSKESVRSFALESEIHEDGSWKDLLELPPRKTVSRWLEHPSRYAQLWLTPRLIRYISTFFLFFVPSFLKGSVAATKPAKAPNPHAIASLDGVRGFASFGVFVLHFSDTYCDQSVDRGFGFDENNRWLFQLPFIRVLWSGPALVSCFFIVSGYVLSNKPLKQMRGRSDAPLLRTLSSAIVRRGIRLYLPTLGATFIAMLLVRALAFRYAHEVVAQGGVLRTTEDTPPYFFTFTEQFGHWWSTVVGMTWLWRWGSESTIYDPHLWTIPAEFQGSMLLFFVLVGVSGLRAFPRMAFVTSFIGYCVYTGQHDTMCFFMGMLLAELDLIIHPSPEAQPPLQQFATSYPEVSEKHSLRRGPKSYRRYAIIAVFIAGFFLMGIPKSNAEATPGYMTLMRIMPQPFHWGKIGCMLLVFSVRNSADVAVLFTNPFAQYLGKISYALYIVHGNVRRSLLYSIMPTVWYITGGQEGQWRYGAGMFLGLLVSWPVTFWCADVFWRGVDIPSVKFARWMEGKVRRREEN
ncbi:MAG: hypothetical protein M1833_000965 [Piccolia ochrophora]|nr:MAG: hypothetical protein M1833_000965 [Piccolia ochrophora]